MQLLHSAAGKVLSSFQSDFRVRATLLHRHLFRAPAPPTVQTADVPHIPGSGRPVIDHLPTKREKGETAQAVWRIFSSARTECDLDCKRAELMREKMEREIAKNGGILCAELSAKYAWITEMRRFDRFPLWWFWT